MGLKSTSALAPLRTFHYPRYDELAEDLVFLDQIVNLVNDVHAPIAPDALSHKKFTAPMAKNFIKQGIIPAPIGRKYSREHTCIMMFAATIKLIYKATQIEAITKTLFEGEDPAKVNDTFAVMLERAMHAVGAGQTAPRHTCTGKDLLMQLSAAAFAEKMGSLMLVDNLG